MDSSALIKPIARISGTWIMLCTVASLFVAVLMWMQWPASGELAVAALIGIKLIPVCVPVISVGAVAKAAS